MAVIYINLPSIQSNAKIYDHIDSQLKYCSTHWIGFWKFYPCKHLHRKEALNMMKTLIRAPIVISIASGGNGRVSVLQLIHT